MKPRSVYRHIPLVVVFAFAVSVGARGLDFGFHWDEPKVQRAVAASFTTGTLLPGWYNYPSMSYGIALVAAAPRAVAAFSEARSALSSSGDKSDAKERLDAVAAEAASDVATVAYLIRSRAHFLVVSLLAVIWVYAFVWRWRRSIFEALVAASLLATSWEVGYHARWVAPDAVLMQFAALAMVALLAALRSDTRHRRWLLAAAAVAGLGAGTKYTGGVLLLPVLVVATMRARETGRRGTVAALAAPVLVFVAAFVVTTPGAVLQPFRFVYDVVAEMRHYQGGHAGHSVSPGPEHAWRMAQYLALVAFSHYWPVALGAFLLAAAAAVEVLRRDRRLAVVLLLVPAVFLTYMSLQRAMFVRNLLLLFPFAAALAARGAGALRSRLGAPWMRAAWTAVLVAGFLLNAYWAVSAAQSVAHRDRVDHGAAVAGFLKENAGSVFYPSRGVYDVLRPAGDIPANVTLERDAADRFLIMTTDLGKWWGNRRGGVERVSGPRDVNLDYYIDWRGDASVFATDPKTAGRMWFASPADTVPR